MAAAGEWQQALAVRLRSVVVHTVLEAANRLDLCMHRGRFYPTSARSCAGDQSSSTRSLEDADNPDQPARQVLQSRVLVIDSATLPPEARLAVAEVSQTANGFRVKMHDKHAALVSIGKHLGMFVDQVQVRARYAISAEPMSAEEWKKQYVREG